MSSIASFISNIAQGIANIPTAIGDFFSGTWEILRGIPQGIGQILRGLFEADEEEVTEEFQEITTGISTKFGIDEFDFSDLFENETPIEDTTLQYTVAGQTVSGKILDTRFLVQGINYFRPYIRGFIMLLIFLYHVKQAMSIFGLDSGSITGQGDITYQQYKGGKDK